MWLVWERESGLIGTYDDHSEALKSYEECKKEVMDYVQENGEFDCEELVIIAKIEKQFYSVDTGISVMKGDDDGNEVTTIDTYWDWKEDNC